MSATTTTFRADRFRKLIEAVEAAPDDRFDMSSWVHNDGGCGTVGCACGWYAVKTPDEFTVDVKEECIRDMEGTIMFTGEWAEHFGITGLESHRLFIDASYDEEHVTKPVVLARLKQFLADHA